MGKRKLFSVENDTLIDWAMITVVPAMWISLVIGVLCVATEFLETIGFFSGKVN